MLSLFSNQQTKVRIYSLPLHMTFQIRNNSTIYPPLRRTEAEEPVVYGCRSRPRCTRNKTAYIVWFPPVTPYISAVV